MHKTITEKVNERSIESLNIHSRHYMQQEVQWTTYSADTCTDARPSGEYKTEITRLDTCYIGKGTSDVRKKGPAFDQQ